MFQKVLVAPHAFDAARDPLVSASDRAPRSARWPRITRSGSGPTPRADPVEAITRVATQEGADLIVVGSQEADGSRHLSSVPQWVMDRVECAVLVV